MELSELVRVAVVEDLKKNVRDLIQKDNYKVRALRRRMLRIRTPLTLCWNIRRLEI